MIICVVIMDANYGDISFHYYGKSSMNYTPAHIVYVGPSVLGWACILAAEHDYDDICQV